jgi:hypothetical protein
VLVVLGFFLDVRKRELEDDFTRTDKTEYRKVRVFHGNGRDGIHEENPACEERFVGGQKVHDGLKIALLVEKLQDFQNDLVWKELNEVHGK